MGGASALYIAAGIAWAAVVFKARDYRRLRETEALIFWLILLLSALAVTVLLPPVYIMIDRLVGIPNLVQGRGNTCRVGDGPHPAALRSGTPLLMRRGGDANYARTSATLY